MNKIAITNYIIIIYFLLLIFPPNLNKYINKENNKNIDKINKKNITTQYLYPPYDDDEDEQRREQIKNISDQITLYEDKIRSLKTQNLKYKIYIIILGIASFLLFILIVIYSSIKCYILCTKKDIPEYRISDVVTNKFGEEYIDDSRMERMNKSIEKNIDDGEAPIYANNRNRKMKKTTFNPDNCLSSSQDRKLYKPYNIDEIQ